MDLGDSGQLSSEDEHDARVIHPERDDYDIGERSIELGEPTEFRQVRHEELLGELE